MWSFDPWRVNGNRQHTERPALPFQAALVYEVAATVYEHGFTFIEAPTGAGKTDIGKHDGRLVLRTERSKPDVPPMMWPSSSAGHLTAGSRVKTKRR